MRKPAADQAPRFSLLPGPGADALPVGGVRPICRGWVGRPVACQLLPIRQRMLMHSPRIALRMFWPLVIFAPPDLTTAANPLNPRLDEEGGGFISSRLSGEPA